jgi:hypothetical protein
MRTLGILLAGAAIAFAQQPQATQLFNGRDLRGWEMVGPGRFVVQNGLLKTEGGMGLLYYKGQEFGNTTLRVVFKTTNPTDNSGVIVRLPEPPPDPWYGVHNGYEVQIDGAGDEWHCTGSIYSLSKVSKRAQKPPGEWNTMEIHLEGDLTRISLNGEVVNEFRGGQAVPERKQWYEPVRGPRPEYGYIGLQNHHRGSSVYFKEVSATPLTGAAKPFGQGERDRLLSYLHGTRKQLIDTVAPLTPAQWTFKPAPNRWSIAEVVEHLAATEEYLSGHARATLKTNHPAPEWKISNEQIVANMKDRKKPSEAPKEIQPSGRWTPGYEVIEAFGERRDRVLDWVRETQQDLTSRYASSGVSAYQFLLMIAAHTERHLAQIDEVRSAPGYPK